MACIRPAGSLRHKSSPGTEASRGLRLAVTSSHRRIDPRPGIRIASAFVFEVSTWLQYPNFFVTDLREHTNVMHASGLKCAMCLTSALLHLTPLRLRLRLEYVIRALSFTFPIFPAPELLVMSLPLGIESLIAQSHSPCKGVREVIPRRDGSLLWR